MRKFDEDFITGRPVEIDIEGRKFKIKELTGEETDKIANSYVKIKDKNTIDIDIAIKNKELLKNTILDAPYEKDGRKWSELTQNERVELLQKLKPGIRSKLLKEINMINGISEEIKKK